jgi:threonine/homoserine/homoserine lactone efflux protein
MTFGWLSVYAAVAARTGELLRRRRARRLLEASTGFVFIGLGVRVAAER